MLVEQISVFLENRTGRLSDVTRALAEGGINIKALSLADATDFGILRLIVTEQDRACAILRERGFTVGRNEVAAIQMTDAPGGLNTVLEALSGSGVNVEYMYAFAHWKKDSATLVCRFDDTQKALEALRARNIPLISREELNSD